MLGDLLLVSACLIAGCVILTLLTTPIALPKARSTHTKSRKVTGTLPTQDGEPVSLDVANLVPYVIAHFDDVEPEQIAHFEREIRKRDRYGEEHHLLYALRVAKAIPNATTIKTLASRWTTCEGMNRSTGLFGGMGSPNHTATLAFVQSLITRQLDEACHLAFDKAMGMKTDRGRENALDRLHDLINDAYELSWGSADDVRKRWLEQIRDELWDDEDEDDD